MPTTLLSLLFSLIILATTSTAFACDIEEKAKDNPRPERDAISFRPESPREQILESRGEQVLLSEASTSTSKRSEPSSLPSSVISTSSENFFTPIRSRLQEAVRTGDPKNPAWNEITSEIKTATKEIYAQLEICSASQNNAVGTSASKCPLSPQEHIQAEQIAIDSIILLATLPALQQSAAAVAAITEFYTPTPETLSPDAVAERPERNLQAYNTIVEKLRLALEGWTVAQESVKSRKKGISHLQRATTESAWQNGLEKLEENVTSYQRSLAVWESDRDFSVALDHYRTTQKSNPLERAFNNRTTLMMETTTPSLESLPPVSHKNRDFYLSKIEHANTIYDFAMATSRAEFLYKKATTSAEASTWNELIKAKQITLVTLEKIEAFLQRRLPAEPLETRDAVKENPNTAYHPTPEEKQTADLLKQIALIKVQHSQELAAWTRGGFTEHQPEQTTQASLDLITKLQRSREAHVDAADVAHSLSYLREGAPL